MALITQRKILIAIKLHYYFSRTHFRLPSLSIDSVKMEQKLFHSKHLRPCSPFVASQTLASVYIDSRQFYGIVRT